MKIKVMRYEIAPLSARVAAVRKWKYNEFYKDMEKGNSDTLSHTRIVAGL